MLKVEAIETCYGQSQVLFGMNLEVNAGEVVTLMGRNGMGKTTTVHSIMGITPIRAGRIAMDDTELHSLPSYKIAQCGLGLVPEGRQIFPNLSVRENLVATAANRTGNSDPWTLARVFEMFPGLSARRTSMGNELSGGEQQMLAVGRALMTNPRLLILDEATEGLAPLIRHEIWHRLEQLKQTGLTILLIDKNIDELTQIADRHFIIEKGQIAWDGDSDALSADGQLKARYLGI